MVLQNQLSLLPHDAWAISQNLAVVRRHGWVVLYNADGPIICFREDDAIARRLAVAVVSHLR